MSNDRINNSSNACYFSATNKDSQASPRTGFFRAFSEGEVVVRRWETDLETFSPELSDSDEIRRFVENKREFDKSCGPYPFDRLAASWTCRHGNKRRL